ncbi:hypothetical protein ACWENO_14085 [Streptomyces sp. NPDC004436]
MTADDRLAEITARHRAATKGPWEQYPEFGPSFYAYLGGSYLQGVGDLNFGDGDAADADRAFVLGAHADIAWLLTRVRELEATVTELAADNATYERALGLNEAAA